MSIFALKIMFPMVRYVYMMLLMLLPLTGSAQFVYSLSPDVRSPRIELNGQWDAMPLMGKNATRTIILSLPSQLRIK